MQVIHKTNIGRPGAAVRDYRKTNSRPEVRFSYLQTGDTVYIHEDQMNRREERRKFGHD